jgi:hypothetical protein
MDTDTKSTFKKLIALLYTTDNYKIELEKLAFTVTSSTVRSKLLFISYPIYDIFITAA